MNVLRRWVLGALFTIGAGAAHAVVDHYIVTAPLAIMKGDSGINFTVDPRDAANLPDLSSHRVLFVVPPGVTVEGAGGTGDNVNGWIVAGLTNFTVRTNGVAPVGFFDLRVRDKNDANVFGFQSVQIEPTVVSFELVPPLVPFTGTAGVGFNLQVRAVGPGGVTITSYRDDVLLSAQIGDLSITVGGAGQLVSGATFVNGVASIVVTLFGTDPVTRQNNILANQVESYAGQAVPATGITSPPLTIEPNVYDHILLRFPGETLTPGTGAGKTGAAATQVAGAGINPVFVDLVDQWHNPINPAANAGIYPFNINYVSFFAGVPADTVPLPSVLNNTNQANVSFVMRVAGNHLIQATAGAEVSQSIVPVVNSAGFRFKVTPDPMPNSDAVTPFIITVEAVDIFDNPLVAYNGTAVVTADNCAGAPFGNNTLDTAPGVVTPGAQNTITFVAGQWINRPVQVFKASNLTRLVFVDAGAGLSGNSTCFDNNAGGAAMLLFTLPGQVYTPGAYPGNLNLPATQSAGALISAIVRVTDLSWNQVSIPVPQPLTLFMDNTVGFIDVPGGLVMPAVGDVTVNNIRLRSSSFRPLSAAVPQVLRAQIPVPNILGNSDGITVNPGAYSTVVVVAPTETLSPGNPTEPDGKINSISTQAFNVGFPMQVYLTDSFFNPVQTPPYAGAWPSLQFTLVGGGDITFPAPNPAPMASSLFSSLVTSRKMGTNTIVVTDTVTPARNSQVSIDVQPGAVTRFVVTPNPASVVPDPIPIQTAGVPFNMTFKAFDGFDNLARNFGGDVTLELWANGVPVPYAGAISPSSVTFVANPITGGEVTIPVTVFLAEPSLGLGPDQLQIRAFINTPALREGFSAFFSVKEEAVWDRIVVTLPGETRRPGLGLTGVFKVGNPNPVLAGDSLLVTVTAVDRFGNRLNQAEVATLSVPTPGVLANLGAPPTVTLAQGVGNGVIQIYTATPTAVVRGEVVSQGFVDTSTVPVTAGSYAAVTGRLLLLAPGETIIPGSPASPGKNTAAILPVQANTNVTFQVFACDRFFNVDTTYTGNAINLSSDDGSVNLLNLAVVAGSATIPGAYLTGNLPNPSIVRVTAVDQGDTNKKSFSDVPVTPGASYAITIPPAALAGANFPMTVELIDPGTGLPMVGANNSFTMEALTPLGAPATVALGVPLQTLTNGSVAFNQSYSHVETIKIRITDSFNRVAVTGNINITPNGLKYLVTLPATSRTTDDIFPVTVGLYDTIQDAFPIADSSYQHTFNVFVEVGGLPAVGSAPVSAATLTNGVATFNFSYTKAEHIVVKATGAVAGFVDISGLDDMDITAGAYVKLQILAPGEVALPGIPSLTGKDSTGLVAQAARESFSAQVNAVDRYWNVVTSLNTPLAPSITLTASDGSSIPSVLGFVNGQALFAGIALNSPPQATLTARDTANAGIFPQSVVIPLTGRVYQAVTATPTPPNYYSGPPDFFDVQLELVRFNGVSTGAIVNGFSGEVTVTPLTATLDPLPVNNLVILNPPLPDPLRPNMFKMLPAGVMTVTMAYKVAEDVVLKFVDEDGWQGFSAPIHFVPRDVRYEAVIPAESPVGPPDSFTMSVVPKDTNTGTVPKNWTSNVTIVPVSPLGAPITGVLQVGAVLVTGGTTTFQQAFSQAGVFRFELQDGPRISSTAAMNFLPGPLAALNTTLPATLEAGTTQSVDVTLLDAFGNPIPNLPVAFRLSDTSFGVLSTANGVSDVNGQSSTQLTLNAQKAGLIDFIAVSSPFSVRQAFRVLGPPTTTFSVGGYGVPVTAGYSLKVADPITLTPDVQPGMVLVETRYSIDGAPFQAYVGPFVIPTVGLHTIEYYSVAQSALLHTETTKTARTVFVTADTDPSEGLVNYPNPFRAGAETFLEFNLAAPAPVKLTIYDMLGQLVYERDVIEGSVGAQAGLNRISWDGRNSAGAVVANGGYVAILKAGSSTFKRKIAVKK